MIKDLYQNITDIIVRQLENGITPWHKPWNDASLGFAIPHNYTTGRSYNGINIVLLEGATQEQNFTTHEWGSYKQWKEKGEQVKGNEKGTMIVFASTYELIQDEGKIKDVPFLKSSVVFNRCQTTNYTPENEHLPDAKPIIERIATVDEFVTKTGAEIVHEGNSACYNRTFDKIYLPDPSQFIDTPTRTAQEGYYATTFHELTHWTGDEKRLNREKGKRFGDKQYAREELIAELGAVFLCAQFEITNSPKDDHAAYIGNWLTALKEDKYAMTTAASHASKAVDYLHSLQGNHAG